MRLKEKAEVSSWGSGVYKYPEQEGETAMCHSPRSRCFSASPPLKIYGGPRGETGECATVHSRAKSTLSASNAKTQSWRACSCSLFFISPDAEGQGTCFKTGSRFDTCEKFGRMLLNSRFTAIMSLNKGCFRIVYFCIVYFFFRG